MQRSSSTPFREYEVAQRHQLDIGGSCDGVARWVCLTDQKIYAVKQLLADRVAADPYLLKRELAALHFTLNVPRVVRMHKCLWNSDGDAFIILELLPGTTMEDALRNGVRFSEEVVQDLAAQLLDTTEYMHLRAGVVHGDISTRNLMVDQQGSAATMSLFDFGGSRVFQMGRKRLTRMPESHTVAFASPETLNIMARLIAKETVPPKELRVDMLASDMWSAGVVLFQLLTGLKPFVETTSSPVYPAELTDPEDRKTWREYHSIMQAQQSWADAITDSGVSGQPIQHPLADLIRAASSSPEQAVHFFTSILHPNPAERSNATQAANHPYLKSAMSSISRDWCSAPLTDPDDEPEAEVASESHTPAEPPMSIPAEPAASAQAAHQEHVTNPAALGYLTDVSDDSGTYDSAASANSVSGSDVPTAAASSKLRVSKSWQPAGPLAGVKGFAMSCFNRGRKFLGHKSDDLDVELAASAQPGSVSIPSQVSSHPFGEHRSSGLASIINAVQQDFPGQNLALQNMAYLRFRSAQLRPQSYDLQLPLDNEHGNPSSALASKPPFGNKSQQHSVHSSSKQAGAGFSLEASTPLPATPFRAQQQAAPPTPTPISTPAQNPKAALHATADGQAPPLEVSSRALTAHKPNPVVNITAVSTAEPVASQISSSSGAAAVHSSTDASKAVAGGSRKKVLKGKRTKARCAQAGKAAETQGADETVVMAAKRSAKPVSRSTKGKDRSGKTSGLRHRLAQGLAVASVAVIGGFFCRK